jgi:hypothetical protein
MTRASHDEVVLDACTRCKGIWFDRHELAAIWRMELGTALAKRRGALERSGVADGGLVLLDALSYNPWLAFATADLAGHVLVAGGRALGNAPEAVTAAAGAAGDAAAGFFEMIAELIGEMFS